MKGYKFKLDAVMKIRKFKEEQCKMEIGQLQVQITNLEKLIESHNEGIQESYQSHEVGLEKGLTARELSFHPYFVTGKKAHIDAIQSEINMLKSQVEAKFEALKQLRADVKVIEEMKEKDRTKYKKNLEKRQFEEIEEQVQNWRISAGK